jgi:hypothetical protein
MKLNRQQRRALNSNKAFCGRSLYMRNTSKSRVRSTLQNMSVVTREAYMREAITDAKQKLNDVANNRSQNNE